MQLSGRHCFLLLVFFTSFLVHTGTAQQLRYAFKNYTPNDGLPSSEVHKVLQDAQHYMWFATDHGVCRYNGYEFKTFNLADNSILGLYEDYKKRIWAWSFSGRLFVFEDGKFEEYKFSAKVSNAIRPGVINALYLDSTNSLYISSTGPNSYVVTEKGEIKDLISIQNRIQYNSFSTNPGSFFSYVRFYPRKFNSGPLPTLNTNIEVSVGNREIKISIPHHYKPELFRTKQFSNGTILFVSDEFSTWIYKDGHYDFQKNQYRIYDVEEIDDVFYFATEKGLMIKDKSGNSIGEYFRDKHITSVSKDYENGLWFTSLLDGVFYLNSVHVKHLARNGDILNRRINILHTLSDSSLLAGTFDGYVLHALPDKFIEETKMLTKPVYSLYVRGTESSSVFVGGPLYKNEDWLEKKAGRGISYIQLSGLSNIIEMDNVLYLGTNDNVSRIVLKDTASFRKALNTNASDLRISSETFRAAKIFVTHKKEFLIGNLLGLWKFTNGKLSLYDSTKVLLKSRITDIAEYRNQALLLGTRGKGFVLHSVDTFVQLTEDQGLVSNNIRKIFIDGNLIWLATNKGISILNILSLKPFKHTIRNINAQDGLLSNEVNDIVKSAGKIIVATNAGISYLDIGYFNTKKSKSLPFYITGIKLNGLDIDLNGLKNLGFRKRNLSVNYEALKFTNSGKLSYRYRLEGYDSTWFYTNDLQLQFNPMPYGKYELQIQAKDELDEWTNSSSSIRIPVICNAPFWATVWFWITVFSLILFLLILAFRKRIEQIRKRQKEDEELQKRITESEQLALKSQMNPHFIFNSLNSIQQYVIDRDMKGANSFISGFSKLMRQTLDFSSKEKITVPEEIAYLKNYLELERMRMESKFDFTITVDTVLPSSELYLPPLMLQPYVENALRHGVRYLRDKSGHIHLSFIERDEVLECIIEDNGIGRDKAAKLKAVNPIEYQSRGMSLTAERVELLNRSTSRLITIVVKDLTNEAGEPCGTSVSVKFPV